MGHSTLIIVSDDSRVIESTRAFGNHNSLNVEVYSTFEWKSKNPSSSMEGHGKMNEGATILPFRPDSNRTQSPGDKICTMNELENVAIRNAIFEFKGNLTEASRALGIGRATLYRKVKQYNIDPSEARRRRAA